MSTNTYPQVQQIHSLSLLTNAAFGLQYTQPTTGPCGAPNAYSELSAYVTAVVNTVLTDDQGAPNGSNNDLGNTVEGTAWECVWGPIVFSNDQNGVSVVADNTMALYYNAQQSLFLVGIAGTNSVSSFGWMDEDFKVGPTQPWSAVSSGTAAPSGSDISIGAFTGINTLLAMTDPNNSNDTLISFLKTKLASCTGAQTIAVAGHSLGGALTPLMALYLLETASGTGTWNTNGLVNNIGAYPTAGPTPGNAAFATYYEGLVAVPPANMTFTFLSLYNSIDVVPQAWELDTLSAVPYIYDGLPGNTQTPTTPPDCMTACMVTAAIMSSYNQSSYSFNGYTQINPANKRQALPGTYEPIKDIVGALKADAIAMIPVTFGINSMLSQSTLYTSNYPSFLVGFLYFAIEAIYQHTTAYNSLLLMSEFVAEYKLIKPTVPGAPKNASLPQHEVAINNLLAKHLGTADIVGMASLATQSAEPSMS